VLLRPVARVRRVRHTEATSEMEPVHPAVNLGLRAIVAAESALPVSGLPGTSLVVRARKPVVRQ
jgi:hypothetical protein